MFTGIVQGTAKVVEIDNKESINTIYLMFNFLKLGLVFLLMGYALR